MIIRRKFGFCEVAMLEPLLREMKRRNPTWQLWVETDYPEALIGHPSVRGVERFVDVDDHILSLDGAEKEHPDKHVMDAMSMMAFGDTWLGDRRIGLGLHAPRTANHTIAIPAVRHGEALVAVSLPDDGVLAGRIRQCLGSAKLVLLGRRSPAVRSISNDLILSEQVALDMRGPTLSVGDVYSIVLHCHAFIGPVDEYLYIAQVTHVPVYAVVGDREEFMRRRPFRRGKPLRWVQDGRHGDVLLQEVLK